MTLADRFSTIEEHLASDDNELNKLDITNPVDRTRLIKQARLLDDKTNQSLTLKRRSASSVSVVYPYAEQTSNLMEREEKIIAVDDNGKIQTKLASSSSSPLAYQGVLRKTPSTSVHGMRTIKSLSVVLGTDRLKRLDSSTSLFQRQTSFIIDSQIDLRTNMKRQVSLVKNKNDITITPQRTVTISPLK
ncbi:unnamed protein product [Rotaria sp. Silwood1]|nr:unnamed protein product [Rotaria sp. Silwood1]